jgi:predicted nucleotidyltransferase
MGKTMQPPDHQGLFAEAVESFYLETRDGLFFAVKGLEHPPDRIIAVLRYAPDPDGGDRAKAGMSYRRLYRFDEQMQWIRSGYPQYLAFDPVFQADLQSVPRSAVRRIYDPRMRLQELLQKPVQRIEADAAAFADLLQRKSGIPSSGLGISGSLLIGLHTELSDLDISVFGSENGKKVHRALRDALDVRPVAGLRRLDRAGMEELYRQRAPDTPMPFGEFESLEKRKINQGNFRGRPYFIRFIKTEPEAGNTYGDPRYVPLGRASITAAIADDTEAIWTPCRYLIDKVRIHDGPAVLHLNEIVSFRGRFCEQARVGESISATGTLERVQSGGENVRHRLLLGNTPEDTMMVGS